MGLTLLSGCTNLDETLYDQVGTQNYYNTKSDVARAVFRPFEHAFWSIQSRHVLNELTADQLITPTRDGWWDDSGKWRTLMNHEYYPNYGGDIQTEWNGCFQGIMQANYVIEDLETLSPEKFGFTQAEFNNLKAQCRCLRAWFYIRLLDAFRNVPLAVSFNDVSKNSEGQVKPKKVYDFIEAELKDCVNLLAEKQTAGSGAAIQGQWTKAGAAALLVRLYLNSEVYIGENHYGDCANWCDSIISGHYGKYDLADRWDAPFDWNNDVCDEVIFGFPADKGYSHWHYTGDTYWWTTPSWAGKYFNDLTAKDDDSRHNTKYACSPSFNPDGTKINNALGCTVDKFRKYDGDVRLRCYKNLGNSTREGLFIYGRLEYVDDKGDTVAVTAPEKPYELYIRDAVGNFGDLDSTKWLKVATSTLRDGDHNSGWHFAKYPFYSDEDAHQLESDYTEIRLAEIYYSYAECLFRQGDAKGACDKLNDVRKRNFPADKWEAAKLTTTTLTEQELLDEWGREFFAESRRRIDLIRFGKFSNGTWWSKPNRDADNHYEIFPISTEILGSNQKLIQNPGY